MTEHEVVVSAGAESFIIKLYDNPTSNSFLEQMPIRTGLKDYAGLEKIFYPDKRLSQEDAPSGATPVKGDIMYYAPWGDVVIFYKNSSRAPGLIPMGRIENVDSFLEALSKSDDIVTFKNK